MLGLLLALLAAVRVFFRSRAQASLEVLALRQQVAVLKRQRPRPTLTRFDPGGRRPASSLRTERGLNPVASPALIARATRNAPTASRPVDAAATTRQSPSPQ